MKKSNTAITLSMLAVFASGILVGGFGHRLYTVKSVSATVESKRPSRSEYRRKYVGDLQARLNLTQEQVVKLQAALDETGKHYEQFRERHKDEMKAIHEDQVRAIRAFLTEAQQAEYTKFREERERKMREQGKKDR